MLTVSEEGGELCHVLMMSDPSGAVAPFLSALRTLPLWILIGLALAGYAVIFAPAFGGIDAEPFRQKWGTWAWVEAMTFSLLALARVCAGIAAHYRSYREARAARRILRFVPLDRQCWWHLAKQQDDSFVSQIRLDIQATNTSDRPVQLVKVRLARPRAELIQADVLLPMEGSPYHSHDHPVPPHGTIPAGVHIMVRGSLATQGESLRVVIVISDQYGEEYKIKNVHLDTHDPLPQRRPFTKRLRDFQPFNWVRADSNPPSAPLPWMFRPGFEYLDICKSVLDEERRSYAANGRLRGGLGSFNVGLQSEPNYSWTTAGQIPQLLWDQDKATIVSSPNLQRLIETHHQLPQEDRDNLESYLLSQLQKDSPFCEVSYFLFLALHRMGRTIDALLTARTFLRGDKIFAYSNLLAILSAVVSREHFDIDPELYPKILDALPNDEHDFKLREKINLAKLEYLDRQRWDAAYTAR
jgi:hypothetical protein